MAGRITGEMLFRLFREGRQPFDLDWSDVGESGRKFYDRIAEKINTQLLPTPARAITGQAIHEFYRKRVLTALPWERTTDHHRGVYNAVAEELNDVYLAHLQGLVREWYQLAQKGEEVNVESPTEIDDWNNALEELKNRTAQVLNVEQKG